MKSVLALTLAVGMAGGVLLSASPGQSKGRGMAKRPVGKVGRFGKLSRLTTARMKFKLQNWKSRLKALKKRFVRKFKGMKSTLRNRLGKWNKRLLSWKRKIGKLPGKLFKKRKITFPSLKKK